MVTGAGGFIGHHLVKSLVNGGYWVRGVAIKYPEYEPSHAHEFEWLDLRRFDNCLISTRGVDEVYNLAADMGGIGYLTSFHAEVARNNTMIYLHMLETAWLNAVERFLFSSSACVYPQYLQKSPDVTHLKEEEAYLADPEVGYGTEKLFMEELCQYYYKDYGFETLTWWARLLESRLQSNTIFLGLKEYGVETVKTANFAKCWVGSRSFR